MRGKWSGSAIAALILLLALSVPSQARADQSGQGGKYDQELQESVNKTLGTNKEFKNVQAKVEDGIVTLNGTVNLFADKEKLERKMHDKDHVQAIRDNVQVTGEQGQSVSDAQLREKLADKLRYDRVGYGITFDSINLGVQNGVVALSGSVLDEPSRASALAIVAGTPGVKNVIDNIQVQPASPMDDDLRIRLARAIYGDPALQKYWLDPQKPIRIVVDRGHVTLAGVVDNQMDKQIAETRAKQVPNVFSVDDKLVVANQQPR
jgi:hyperosmotically inducible periplasmic protein